MPGFLGNQRPLGCCHAQSNAGGEASWLGHYALTLPSVELQEKKKGERSRREGKEKAQEGERGGRGRGPGRGRALETASSEGLQSTKS